MTDNEQQAADDQVAPDIDPLEAALREFDDQGADRPKPQPQTAEVVSRKEFEDLKRQLDASRVETGINEAVAVFRQEFGGRIPEDFARRHLYGEADLNPKFAEAFQRRTENPEAWNKAVKAFAGKVQAQIGGPSDDDVNINAVRAAANAQPNAPSREDEDENAKARKLAEQDPNSW